MKANSARAIRMNSFGDPGQLAASLADTVAEALREAIGRRGEALIAVSGGTTPKLFFQTLSKKKLDWRKVTVCLVDERFVPPENERSNHRLVGTHLLQNEAADAAFIPLYQKVGDVEAAAALAAGKLDTLSLPFDVVILGMGTDGHTASFFPGGDNLQAATDPNTTRSVLAMEAANAGEPRLTMTLPQIVGAGRLIVHIEGDAKKDALDEAVTDGPESVMPIRAVFDNAAAPVDVYWAP